MRGQSIFAFQVLVCQLLLVLRVDAAAVVRGAATAQYVCKADLDCSLNGVCSTAGVCECGSPWTGPSCGVLKYKTTPASGRSLYNESDPRNTWNGAIIRGPDGVYHLYNPIYAAGTLGGTTTMLHGTAENITGPYVWGKQPDITIGYLGAFNGPKSVVYTESSTNKTKYSLWLGGGVYLADSLSGPFTQLEGFTYPGDNPAPLWHNGAFYTTNSPCQTVYTTPHLVAGAKWTVHGTIDHTVLPENWIAEDPTMWVDKRGSFHIINHAYNPHEWEHCATSVLSSHFFSLDGTTWHFLPEAVQPYTHTVDYDDGTSHMFVTMERPSVYFDEHGEFTHIHLAADLVTGNEGCGDRVNHTHFGHCPCDNCKYEDHGGTTIIALDV
eukprot:m.112188 g.112188  ORF g.112188 m.112188 type:complete len:381 (+) comp28177_c0_seq1:81-1223(+)